MATSDAGSLFDIADQIDQVCGALMRYRVKTKLTREQKRQLETTEIELEKATAQIRAQGIAALVDLTQAARQEVEAATQAAEAVLRRIRKAERALQVAASVLDLALAAASGQAKAIVAAAKGVKAGVDADSA